MDLPDLSLHRDLEVADLAKTPPRPARVARPASGQRRTHSSPSSFGGNRLAFSDPVKIRPRPSAISLFRSSPPDLLDEVGDASFISPLTCRPRTQGTIGNSRCLSLSSSLGSLKASLADSRDSPNLMEQPGTPVPERSSFKNISGGMVALIFFDFDGTLTATPGDRAARPRKQIELCDRAPMLKPKLRALREAGVSLGIISKSTEPTIRDALQAASLDSLFDAPIVGKAVGFEGKAGFIEELSQSGALRGLGSRGFDPGQRSAAHRILLVDDDVLELERAQGMGMQAYAAPAEGGLQEQDLDAILAALQLPPSPPRHSVGPATRRSSSRAELRRPRAASATRGKPALPKPNLILFSGECFEG